jgi:hypothetical protein
MKGQNTLTRRENTEAIGSQSQPKRQIPNLFDVTESTLSTDYYLVMVFSPHFVD